MKIIKNKITFKKIIRKVEIEVDEKRTAKVSVFSFHDEDFEEQEYDSTIENEELFTDEEIDEINEIILSL